MRHQINTFPLLFFIMIMLSAVDANAQCDAIQIHKLVADDGAAGDRFGQDVYISGDLAIVGARGDDDNGEDSGSAYLFDIRTGEQLHKLLPEDGAASHQFGVTVGISGSVAIVGTRSLESDGDGSGAVYLFNTTTGEQLHKLQPNSGPLDGGFNIVVGISGNVAIVGDPDASGTDLEAAYLFDTTTGQQIHILVSEDHTDFDSFGHRVAINGNLAIAGASGDDDNGDFSGSAYLFDVTTGEQIHKLLPDDGAADDNFGLNVDIGNEIAIVGTDKTEDNGLFSGSAYLFDLITGQQIHKLLPADNAYGDHFGYTVGVYANLAIVGAHGDDDNGDGSGSAYLFDTNTGEQLYKFLPKDGAAGDRFGHAVAIDGGLAVISAHNDDDNGEASGSAYVFDISSCVIVLGDANDDGVFNNGDIASFVLALTNPDAYQAMFPDVDPNVVLDMNGDGAFNNGDIAAFVAALTGGTK